MPVLIAFLGGYNTTTGSPSAARASPSPSLRAQRCPSHSRSPRFAGWPTSDTSEFARCETAPAQKEAALCELEGDAELRRLAVRLLGRDEDMLVEQADDVLEEELLHRVRHPRECRAGWSSTRPAVTEDGMYLARPEGDK